MRSLRSFKESLEHFRVCLVSYNCLKEWSQWPFLCFYPFNLMRCPCQESDVWHWDKPHLSSLSGVTRTLKCPETINSVVSPQCSPGSVSRGSNAISTGRHLGRHAGSSDVLQAHHNILLFICNLLEMEANAARCPVLLGTCSASTAWDLLWHCVTALGPIMAMCHRF